MYLPRHPQIALFLRQLSLAAQEETPAEQLLCPICGQPLELEGDRDRLAALCPGCCFHAAVSRPCPFPTELRSAKKPKD